MAAQGTWQARAERFMNRYHARRAGRAATDTYFRFEPAPRAIGSAQRGEHLIKGKFLFAGLLVDKPERSLWDVAQENDRMLDEAHSFGWLDDLAAVGDERARFCAEAWVFDWIARFGSAEGKIWTPDVTGHRVIRWIHHAGLILRGKDRQQTKPYFDALGRQIAFLAKRAKFADPVLPRIEALAATAYAAMHLSGMEDRAGPALAALADACTDHIGPDGAVATRNPEELAEVLGLLNMVVSAARATKQDIPGPIPSAVKVIVPVLRALRHADGGLARFHGGSRGAEGRLDSALAEAAILHDPKPQLQMGYARLFSGRTTVIADAAAPPTGAASGQGHASTLAFEMTSGRRPVIVNCGPGDAFGGDWQRASRATPSHSTMMIVGVSTSQIAPQDKLFGARDQLYQTPEQVAATLWSDGDGRHLKMSHNGYQTDHGLSHQRQLHLAPGGRRLFGEDVLTTMDEADQDTFQKAIKIAGIPYVLRFHLHPDVVPYHDASSGMVTLDLKSGETWEFRHDSDASMSLAPSIYFERAQLKPVSTQQVVLSGHAMSYATRVRWTLAKTRDTPRAVRDPG